MVCRQLFSRESGSFFQSESQSFVLLSYGSLFGVGGRILVLGGQSRASRTVVTFPLTHTFYLRGRSVGNERSFTIATDRQQSTQLQPSFETTHILRLRQPTTMSSPFTPGKRRREPEPEEESSSKPSSKKKQRRFSFVREDSQVFHSINYFEEWSRKNEERRGSSAIKSLPRNQEALDNKENQENSINLEGNTDGNLVAFSPISNMATPATSTGVSSTEMTPKSSNRSCKMANCLGEADSPCTTIMQDEMEEVNLDEEDVLEGEDTKPPAVSVHNTESPTKDTLSTSRTMDEASAETEPATARRYAFLASLGYLGMAIFFWIFLYAVASLSTFALQCYWIVLLLCIFADAIGMKP